jgi:glycosyltransferase involved in cell wall biosynthesis
MNGISIVVCTHNSARRIEPALKALFQLEQPEGVMLELIIVDNASTDGTGEHCVEIANQAGYTGSFKVVQEPQPGLNHARLKGLFTSSYEWVLFCDDDNELFPDYIVRATSSLICGEQLGALGGCGIPRFEGQKPDWFDRYSHSFAVGPQAAADGLIPERPAELYGAGCLFRKQPLLALFKQGFATVLTDRKGKQLVSGGDVEWCYLIQLAGYSLGYNSSMKFYHYMPDGRMQWEYYLRLKTGITSGAAKLTGYHCLFKNRKASLLQFGIAYLTGTLRSTQQWLQFRILKLLAPGRYAHEIADIGKAVTSARMKAYWSDCIPSFQHFQKLKRFH